MEFLAVYLSIGVLSFLVIDLITKRSGNRQNFISLAEGIVLIIIWPYVYVRLLKEVNR